MLLITAFFSVLRPYNSMVYAPKLRYADDKHAPPAIGKGFFAWFTPVAGVKELELIDKVGLDATVFLRFTRMCRNMFLIMAIFGCGILIPAHIYGGNSSITKGLAGTNEAKAFGLMTPQYCFGNIMWSHVVCAWIFDIIIAFFLWINYRAVLRLKRKYFQSPEYQMSLHSRTLWIRDIHAAQRSDEGILQITEAVGARESNHRAAIGRNVKELPELIEEHEKAVRRLESVLSKFLKNPDKLPRRPAMRPFKGDRRQARDQKIDAIEYLTGHIQQLEATIREVRESVDKRNAMGYGFAIFEAIEPAHNVAFAARSKHPMGSKIELAPKPNDMIWKNLPLQKAVRNRKRWINSFWIGLMTVVWIAPNALIAIFLTNLANLAALWPGFASTYDASPHLWGVIQGVASPALTSLIYLMLPILFRRIRIRAGDQSKTQREHHVAAELYAFFVFNNLIIFSLFSAISTFVASVITTSGNQGVWNAMKSAQLASTIKNTLCSVSPFWVTWLLQRNLGAAVDLAQMWTLFWTWFARTFMSPTPRQTIEWTAPQPFDYASYYNYFLFYATVTLCFATIQPLVLPVTALYFTIDSWLKKYLLLYVFITKTESGGRFWRMLFNRIIFAIILANLISMLIVKSALGSWTMVGCIAPLPLLMLGFKYYCAKVFDNPIKYYTRGKFQHTDQALPDPRKIRHGGDRIGVKFGHPALYKPLITPMVHAKAQHILSTIYHGRTGPDNSDGASTIGGYSDSAFAMDDMSATQPGKMARFADGTRGPPRGVGAEMFEIVPESNLDFGYYKNRAEFADEYGGGGELYGRPIDMMSERSQTPKSFLGHGGDSGNSSRASSPRTSGFPPGPGGSRIQPEYDAAFHPAYRDGPHSREPSGGGNGLYNISQNESESGLGLVHHSQPVGFSEPAGSVNGGGEEQYGLDRWRPGGRGYMGVPHAPVDEEGDTGYAAYRPGR